MAKLDISKKRRSARSKGEAFDNIDEFLQYNLPPSFRQKKEDLRKEIRRNLSKFKCLKLLELHLLRISIALANRSLDLIGSEFSCLTANSFTIFTPSLHTIPVLIPSGYHAVPRLGDAH